MASAGAEEGHSDETERATLLCQATGAVVFATPAAVLMLARVGVTAEEGQALLPPALWDDLHVGPVGEAREWPTGTGTLSVRRYPAHMGRTLLIFQEISSGRKNLVQRLHQQRTEAISALVANIAHDVRNPLSAMLFNVESLSRCACESPDICESIQGLRDATGILCRIVDGLVDFAALSPSREGIPVARVLDRLKSLLRGGAACRQSHAGSHGRSVHL
jgi:signal transduction histidine kinase